MTAFGEWDWNFGILGELAGTSLFGVLLGGLWRLAGRYPIYEPPRMLLYVDVIVSALMLPEASSVVVHHARRRSVAAQARRNLLSHARSGI